MEKFISLLFGFATLPSLAFAKDNLFVTLAGGEEWSQMRPRITYLGAALLVGSALYRIARKFYLWNFVMLKGFPGPPSQGFIFGNMAQVAKRA
jgi:hypothetical protein